MAEPSSIDKHSNPAPVKKGSRKAIILIALLVMLAGGGGIVSYYWYMGQRFVSTEDSRLAANVVAVSPEIAGRILSWNIREGDIVRAGDIIGRQDLGAALTNAAINPQSLVNLGGVMAEKAQFKAPINGQVIQSNAIIGQMAAPGQSLAIIADTDNLYVSANIKEDVIQKIHVGEEVEVKVDAFPDRTFRGQVENIGRATASTFSLLGSASSSGNFTKVAQVIPIRIHLSATDGAALMVGMNTSIRITVDQTK